MVIGEDEDNWPKQVNWLKDNNVFDEIRSLGEEIGNEFGQNLNRLLELHDGLSPLIEETKEEINKIELTTRLKGGCRYL